MIENDKMNIKLVIKDQNDNIIYEKTDGKDLTEEEVEYICDALNNLDTNSVDFSLNYNNVIKDNSLCSYHGLVHRSGKDSILNEAKEIIEEYNNQLAALPDRHPSEHDPSLQRGADSVGPDGEERAADMKYGGPVKTSDDLKNLNGLVERLIKERKIGNPYEFKPYSWQKHLDRHGWTTIPKHNVDFGHYTLLGDCRGDVWGRDGCEDVVGCDGRVKRVVDLCPPGAFAFSDKFSRSCDDSCERDGCEGASDDVEPVQEWVLSETPKRAVKDFIGYLRTRDSWATLLDEIGFYHDPDDDIGKQKLIDQFCEYMRRKENQEFKEWRERKR